LSVVALISKPSFVAVDSVNPVTGILAPVIFTGAIISPSSSVGVLPLTPFTLILSIPPNFAGLFLINAGLDESLSFQSDCATSGLSLKSL